MSLDRFLELVWGSLSQIEKGMILFTLVVYLLFAVYNPSTREKTAMSVVMGSKSLVRISLLLLSGIFLGSLVGVFLPRSLVARLLGKESGFYGILLGTLFGAVMPGGPYVLFPIIASLYASGAAIPPMIAMIFSWQCIALTRTPTDLAFLSVVEGQKIIWLRILMGIPIPIIAGLLVGIIWRAI